MKRKERRRLKRERDWYGEERNENKRQKNVEESKWLIVFMAYQPLSDYLLPKSIFFKQLCGIK